jgi:DNA replication protein DnaC
MSRTNQEVAQNAKQSKDWPQQESGRPPQHAEWPQQDTERPNAAQQELVHPEELDEMLRLLRLPAFRHHLKPLIEDAEREQYSYRTFLSMLCAEELASRKEKHIAREVRRAHLPEIVTIDDLDFTYQTSIRRRQLGSYLDTSLVSEGRCAIFLGSSGNAKTALAIAIAYQAI